jgi:hypothetical protein
MDSSLTQTITATAIQETYEIPLHLSTYSAITRGYKGETICKCTTQLNKLNRGTLTPMKYMESHENS